MPTSTDADPRVPPPDVEADVRRMAAAAAAAIPARTASNLLVATWNLRAFADLTPKWQADSDDSPKRDWHAVACIAAVLGCFDVVAVQEVRRNISALRFLLDQLGGSWRVLTTDVTEGTAGNGERLTFLYRTDRLQPSGLVGEIVLPPAPGGQPSEQFARNLWWCRHPHRHAPRRVIDEHGRLLEHAQFPASPAGYARLLTWMRRIGQLDRVGVEGTGAYGAGLALTGPRRSVQVL